MGSLSTHKPKGQSLRDFFEPVFRWPDHPEAGLIDLAVHQLRTGYAAVRHPDGFVFATVILIHYSPRDYYNITYKEVTESEGPYATDCPKRILDLLTPAEELINVHGWKPDGHWLKWRDACHKNLAASRERKNALRDGALIRFNEPIRFNNQETLDTFVLKREKTFRGGTRTLFYAPTDDLISIHSHSPRYSITRWRQRNYEVVGYINT